MIIYRTSALLAVVCVSSARVHWYSSSLSCLYSWVRMNWWNDYPTFTSCWPRITFLLKWHLLCGGLFMPVQYRWVAVSVPGLWNEWDVKPYTDTHPHFCLSLIVTLCGCHLWRKLRNLKLRLSVCFVAAFFSWAGWAFHISWSKCCLCVWASVCVWMLTKVAQIVTAAHRDL